MAKLLEFSIYGIKSIDKEIKVTVNNCGESKKTKKGNVVGIFGFNGAGKTALIEGIELYKNLVTKNSYLSIKSNRDYLSSLINQRTREIRISVIFKSSFKDVYKHELIIKDHKITQEKVYLLGNKERDKEELLIEVNDGRIITCSSSSTLFLKRVNNVEASDASVAIKVLLFEASKRNYKFIKIKKVRFALVNIFYFANELDVILNSTRRTLLNLFELDKKEFTLSTFLKDYETPQIEVLEDGTYKVPDDLLNDFIKFIKRLELFLKIFKGSLLKLSFDDIKGANYHYARLILYYESGYFIDLEKDSLSTKKLVRIFNSLYKATKGKVAFIDDIEINLNEVYFLKLISYLTSFIDGQLIFTSNNFEAMNFLKNKNDALYVLGYNSQIERRDYKSKLKPIKEYEEGSFIHSPVNLEDFDFVYIFEGELLSS